MKLLITGDLVINKSYDVSDKIDQSVINLFSQSDFNIVNLEAPITDSKHKILKTGPHLKSDKQCTLEVMKKLNVNIASLANNHIKDYNEQGVLDTISFCENNNIKAIGAGANIKEASQTTILNTSEGSIAIINIAENEWSSADEVTAGANGMSLIKDTKKIQKAKKDNNFVLVIIHGGHEYYNLPSPRMQEQYRFYAEQGADLIVGHHTHCISGYEIHNATPIFYSLGNFLFTENSLQESWYTGLVLEVEICRGELNTILHPIRQQSKSFKVSMLKGKEKSDVLLCVEDYKKIIENKDSLLQEWNRFVISKRNSYLNYWSPKVFIRNKYISYGLNKLKINLTNTKGLSYYLNLLRCEAHHDLSKAILEENLKK